MKTVAIVLAAGQGKRMNSEVQKQYLMLLGKPVLYYSLSVFEKSTEIDAIIVVTGESEIEYVRGEIINKYNIRKATTVVAGGKERYHSVYNGLQAVSDCDYVFIHDGARPFVDEAMIVRAGQAVKKYQAAVIGMPVKDTIKIADEDGCIQTTPKREMIWAVQTPQAFFFPLIKQAYEVLWEREAELSAEGKVITDDAMVVETFTDKKIKLVEGSYRNIKITTPEDLEIAKALM